jgi:hypothetical protein
MNSLILQNIPSPSDIFLPRLVSINSLEDVKQRRPIRNNVKAMKNVCTVIIWRLIRLNDLSSVLQLKYFGKTKCTNAKAINRKPIILKCISILVKYKGRNKWRKFYFLSDF